MPTPRLTNQVRQTRPPLASMPGDDASVFITTEKVEGPAVGLGGFYYIKGTPTPTRQQAQFQTGQAVSVMWKKGKPFMILDTQQTPGSGHDVPPTGGSPVEELYVAQRTDAVWDVFFRNALEHVPLRVPEKFGVDCSGATVKWGPGNDRFFVQVGTQYHIMKFSREKFKVFTSTGAASRLSRERVEDLSTNDMVLAHVTVPSTLDIKVNVGAGRTPLSFQLDTDGNLIGSYVVSLVDGSVPSTEPAPNLTWASSLTDAIVNGGWVMGAQFPVIADLTNRVVLLSGFDDVSAVAPFVTFLDWNGPRSPISWFGSSFNGVPRAVTWVTANSFIVLPSGDTITWMYGFSQDPNGSLFALEPVLVLGTSVPAARRIRGLVAWRKEVSSSAFIVQVTNGATPFQYVPFNGDPLWFPVNPGAPFPITDQAGAAARSVTGPLVTLFAFDRPSFGISYAPTYNRVVWAKSAAGSFRSKDDGLDIGAAANEGLMTYLGTATAPAGPNVHATADLRAHLGRRGLNVVPADFLYQLDNPVTAVANEATDRFLSLWDFGQNTPVPRSSLDTNAYTPDPELKDAGALKGKLPGVTQPKSLGLYSVQVVNDRDALPSGRFAAVPTT